MSLPSAIGSMPHASATAAPPLLPPHVFVEVVRIARRAEHGVERLRSGAELRRVRLADGDRAGRADPRHDERVARRHVVAVERRAARRADARRVDEILVRDRQAVQHAERAAARRSLRRPCAASAIALLGDERDDGVDLRVDALDLRQVRGHDLARRHLLCGRAAPPARRRSSRRAPGAASSVRRIRPH